MTNAQKFGAKPAIYVIKRVNDNRLINQWHDDKRTHDKPVLIWPTDIKFGIATDMDARIAVYDGIFGVEHLEIAVYEIPGASKADLEAIEMRIKQHVLDVQIRSPWTNRRREWCNGITYEQMIEIVEETLA